MQYGYFAAADDAEVVRILDRFDEQAEGTGHFELVVKHADPLEDLLPAEMSLTGRTEAELEADPRRGKFLGEIHDGELAVLALSDVFKEALSGASDADLRVAAAAIAGPSAEDVVSFFKSLAELARREASHHLYCWISL
ncbi:hypothetical protein ACGFMK_14810 [Amycolatopsis sp. NPDC049252]|uniref:hypothetical protein n=1 Tax=Amycolatopsis sp. NPDC049252 TaxID=3363933 RepID=UPI003716769F